MVVLVFVARILASRHTRLRGTSIMRRMREDTVTLAMHKLAVLAAAFVTHQRVVTHGNQLSAEAQGREERLNGARRRVHRSRT